MKTLPLTMAVSMAASLMLPQAAHAQDSAPMPPPRRPPLAALQACANAQPAGACQFAINGQNLAGTCLAPPGLPLACVPEGAPPPPGMPPDGGGQGGGPGG